jgi:ABC-2 type transport system permease protein
MGSIRAFIIIPDGFGIAISADRTGITTDISLDVSYDESDMAASSEISATIYTALISYAGIHIPFSIDAHPVNVASRVNEIDFLAPGIIVFGLLIMIPTSAWVMRRDREKGYLARLLTTPAHFWEFILGYTLCLLVIAIVQIIFFILLGWLFGMNITGSPLLAFLAFFLTAISSIGVGMVAAAISKSENQAEQLTWLFAIPLAVLSGVWFSPSLMPKMLQTIARLFPYAHAVESSRAILLRGAGFQAVQNDIAFLAAWAFGAILIGILLFSRRMRS